MRGAGREVDFGRRRATSHDGRRLAVIAMLAASLGLGESAMACLSPQFCLDPSVGGGSSSDAPDYSASEWRRITQGEAVLKRASRPGFSPRGNDHVWGALRVEAPVKEVWAVLSDLERWPATFADVDQVHLERRADGRLLMDQWVNGLGKTLRYSSVAHVDEERFRLSVVMTGAGSADFDDMAGRWRLVALPDDTTLVELRLRGDSSLPVPGFVQRRLIEQGVRRSLHDVARASMARDEPSPAVMLVSGTD